MINKTWQKWSNEEIELLKFHWKNSTMETLLKTFPNRKYYSLMGKAMQLKIKSEAHRSRVNGNLEKLKEKNKDIFHLWGFLMADGCFTQKYDLIISQKSTEKEYLIRIVKTLGCDINKIKTRSTKTAYSDNLEMCHFRVGHKKVIQELYELTGLSGAKTYTPPTKIEYFFEKELLIYFMVGLIEGDGCVWLTSGNWPNIRIELHYNWLPILEKLSKALLDFYQIESSIKVSKRGFAQIYFAKKDAIKKLLTASKDVKRMESKWKKLETINFG